MKFIKITIILSFTLLFICGFYKNYIVYDYKPIETKFNWGIVGARLLGSEKESRNTITKGSPYELLVWFGSDTYIKGNIHINNLKLIYNNSDNVAFVKHDIMTESIVKKTENYRAYFSFNNIDISYDDMVLQIEFQLEQDGKLFDYITDLFFEKDYREFRRIIGV
ncbi:MAG: hypothetical protein CSA18_04890 [Deltaproteobacteria bacterium]|nr:MAG: hypothetical protein CSA18_04890 [Deltaproteobacteria bacterium]